MIEQFQLSMRCACQLYREAVMAVRKCKQAKSINVVLCVDFVSVCLSNGRRLKYLTLTDKIKALSVYHLPLASLSQACM